MNLTAFAAAALLAVFAEPVAEEAEEKPSSAEPASASASEPKETKPSIAARWWNGEESIYSTGLNLSFGFTMGGFNGDKLHTEGAKGRKSTGMREGKVAGFRADIGTYGRHFGILLLGGAYYTGGEDLVLEFPEGPAPVTLRAADLRLLQPRLRFAKWRFELAASAGPIVHLGWARLNNSRLGSFASHVPAEVRLALDSSAYAVLALEAGASLRFYPISLLFVEGGYGHSFSLWSLTGDLDGMNSFRAAAGLAF